MQITEHMTWVYRPLIEGVCTNYHFGCTDLSLRGCMYQLITLGVPTINLGCTPAITAGVHTCTRLTRTLSLMGWINYRVEKGFVSLWIRSARQVINSSYGAGAPNDSFFESLVDRGGRGGKG